MEKDETNSEFNENKVACQISVSYLALKLELAWELVGRAAKSGLTFLEQIPPFSNVPARLFINFDFHLRTFCFKEFQMSFK